MYSLNGQVNHHHFCSVRNFELFFEEDKMSAVASKARSDIVVRPSTPVIGAEIEGIDLSRPLTTEEVDDIHQALLQWKVLFFRNQEISDEQQLAFGRYFGKLTPAHPIML